LENPTNYPVVNPSHLIVTNPLAPENNYRGVVTGTAREVITNNTHEVRAYLLTDTEYEQPGVIPGTVASNGSWSLDLSAIPIGFAGSWRFRLYEIATNTEIGESWPREDILDGLEISLFSVTDAEYFIAKDRALPSQLFSFGTTTAGTKRVKLIDTRGTLTTGDDVVLDSYTGGTGLVRSYELSVGNEGFGTPFQERNYVYDQALALSSAISIGDIDRASDLATGLVKSQQSGGDYDGAFFFSVPQLSPTSGETIFRTGAHSIALYSLLHYIEANPGDSKISIYYESAQRALSYLDGLRVDMGPQEGLYLGGSGRYISDVYEDYSIPWASTEHNLDTWHAFKKAQKVLNDDLYESKAISLQNTILSKLWNPGSERFSEG
jgi:hypothetical protein